MKGVLLLAGAIVALVLVIAPGLRPSPDGAAGGETANGASPPTAAAPDARGAPAPAAGASVVATRSPEGHFTTQARVNGAAFPMVVDSGASLVVLRREDALAAGISVFPAEFTGTAQTAGGPVRTKRVVIDRLSIGGIERRNIAAAVVDADLPMSLLGQSFLAQLGEVRIVGDAMILR